MNTSPLYPFSLSARYRLMCPKGASGACQGFIQIRQRRGIVVFYCHDRMCKELFPQMLDCPCDEPELCEGSFWKNEVNVCRRQERIDTDKEMLN